jgi:hypothetical protein
MVILKATTNSESGVMPTMEEIERTIRFNEEMVKAGILKAADGLKPSKFGKRITYRPRSKKSITDGPFAETKELVAGYWIWEVKSMDEAMEWAMRIPDPAPGQESDIEIRPFFGPEDFGEEFTPELQERVDEMHRHEAAAQKS